MIKIEIDNFLTENECAVFIELGNDMGYKKPKIKTPQGEMVREDFRNNGSALLDNANIADELFERFKDKLPQEIDGYKLKGLN